MLLGLLTIFLGLLVFLWVKLTSKPKNFPPGPSRLPIVGSVLDLKSPHSSTPSILWGIVKFEKIYGEVIGLYLGYMRTVALTNYEDIKEIMNMEETASRPPAIPCQIRPGWEIPQQTDPIMNKDRAPGVILSNGNYWREQRRYALRNLRDFGFGKSSMESSLNEEVSKMIENLKTQLNQPMKLNKSMNISVLNALWAILVGEKLSLDDPKLLKTLDLLDEFLRSAEGPTSAVAMVLPFSKLLMTPIFRKLLKIDQLEEFFGRVINLVKPAIENHQQTLDENNIRDFMDQYLCEVSKTTNPRSTFHASKGTLPLQNLMLDLFIAGTETTSSSLTWAILFLLKNPECQEKIAKEIEREVGKDRMVSLEDRKKMNYTNAFLLEALRAACLVPLSVFHYTFEDIKVKNFVIPKNTAILPSLYHVHYDPKLFPDPETFKPERFLDAEGNFLNDEHVVPFGIGKRYCLGKSLAEKEYFLFFVGMVQNFEICNPPRQTLPKTGINDVPCPGLARIAPSYEVILKLRH